MTETSDNDLLNPVDTSDLGNDYRERVLEAIEDGARGTVGVCLFSDQPVTGSQRHRNQRDSEQNCSPAQEPHAALQFVGAERHQGDRTPD